MNVLDPYLVTDTTLTATNVTEADYAEYDAAVTYAAAARVIVIGSVHKVYESAVGSNLGNAPSDTTASTDFWIYVGATNRYKPFDERTTDRVTRTTPITYSFTDPRYVSALAFFNIDGANEVTIVITDTGSVEVYNETVSLIDVSHMTDWFLFFTEAPRYKRQKLITGLPFTAGATIDLEFVGEAATTIGVGQIVLGRDQRIGKTQVGTRAGFRDYSRKERNAFGEAIIVERDFRRKVDYSVVVNSADADNIIEDLAALRAKGAVYFADEDTGYFGTTVYGLLSDFDVPLQTNLSFINIEVESL
jgi:hypothetical protein